MTILLEEVLDSVLACYRETHSVDDIQFAMSRERLSRYLIKVASAGRRDHQDLAEYARAYLKELREGPDPEFTGC